MTTTRCKLALLGREGYQMAGCFLLQDGGQSDMHMPEAFVVFFRELAAHFNDAPAMFVAGDKLHIPGLIIVVKFPKADNDNEVP
jgi:hypothetical protein